MPSKTFAVLCFTICGALVCPAQVEQGAISGAVADQTGAAIGAAKVTATNKATNTMVGTESNDEGYFKLPYSTPGKYTVTAEKTGFTLERISSVPVLVGQTATIDFSLKPGPVHEEVTVSSDDVLVEQQSSSLGYVAGVTQILQLPLGRNPYQVTLLAPATLPLNSVDTGTVVNGGLALTTLFGADVVDSSTLQGKVLLGYQGWFNCPGDGAPGNSWRTWARGVPAADTLTVDLYPDLRELDSDETCPVPGMSIGTKPAYLYSAWNQKTVMRHFLWMKQYGLDGVLVQRFVTSMAGKRSSGDVVLKNVMAGAEKYGRVFAIEYDITGADPVKVGELLIEDWKYLVDELKVTSHPNYLHDRGKPLLSVWGMGLHEDRHVPHDPDDAKRITAWFCSGPNRKYRVTYMGGTPARWRTLVNDARPEPAWLDVYAMMDVIQPWTVGRYRDNAGVDRWKEEVIIPDLALTVKRKQLYMPVIFPGFSWHNLKPDAAKNAIPRNRGEFLWRQAYNARVSGATLLKIAMFDEVNEGTAIFKVASRRKDAPDQGFWLTLDADGASLPGDWYLRLAGEITRMFHGQRPATPTLPDQPLQ